MSNKGWERWSCYYYNGVSDEDMFAALGHLIDFDQADAEYRLGFRMHSMSRRLSNNYKESI